MNRISNRVGRVALVAIALALWTAGAEAQLDRGALRFSIDGDMLAIGGVKSDPDGPAGPSKATVVGFGPNQLGNMRAHGAGPTPIGLGFGYVLQPNLILGIRGGLGYDVISPDGGSNIRYLDLSLMPGITFVPMGKKAKLALNAAPIFQVSRGKRDGAPTEHALLGGFGLGIGALIFVHNRLSADVGFQFEGRFGNYDRDDRSDNDIHIRDLRGVVRIGLSFWR
jgi:hypothetical protein